MQGFRHFIDENIYECNEYTHVKYAQEKIMSDNVQK